LECGANPRCLTLLNRKDDINIFYSVDDKLQQAYHASDEELKILRRSIERAVKVPLSQGAYRNAELPDAANIGKLSASFGKHIVGIEPNALTRDESRSLIGSERLTNSEIEQLRQAQSEADAYLQKLNPNLQILQH
jgi:hypothetical protein